MTEHRRQTSCGAAHARNAGANRLAGRCRVLRGGGGAAACGCGAAAAVRAVLAGASNLFGAHHRHLRKCIACGWRAARRRVNGARNMRGIISLTSALRRARRGNGGINVRSASAGSASALVHGAALMARQTLRRRISRRGVAARRGVGGCGVRRLAAQRRRQTALGVKRLRGGNAAAWLSRGARLAASAGASARRRRRRGASSLSARRRGAASTCAGGIAARIKTALAAAARGAAARHAAAASGAVARQSRSAYLMSS